MALASVNSAVRQSVKPLLDDMHLDGMRAGLAHWIQQNQTINHARVLLAQTSTGTIADGASGTIPSGIINAQLEHYPQADSSNEIDDTMNGNGNMSSGGNIQLAQVSRSRRTPNIRSKKALKPESEAQQGPLMASHPLFSQDPKDVPFDNYARINRTFKTDIAKAEQSQDYGTVNRNLKTHQAVAVGLYQLQLKPLIDVGMLAPDSKSIDDPNSWIGPLAQYYGVFSLQDFLANPSAQEAALDKYLRINERYLEFDGTLQYQGRIIHGLEGDIPVTYAGLMAAAHREGHGAVFRYFQYLEKHLWDSKGIENLPQGNSFKNIERRLRTFAGVDPYMESEE